MKGIFGILCLILLNVFMGCGLKTDPKSKDSFQIDKPTSVSIVNTSEGVTIQNSQKNYSVILERATRTKDCLTPFEHLSTIPGKSAFLDEDVIPGTTYIYRTYNLDTKLNINSLSSVFTITYNAPISVTSIHTDSTDNVTITITPKFSASPQYYNINLNGKELAKTRKSSFDILLENRVNNTIGITPFDDFGNKGQKYTKTFINEKAATIPNPRNIQFIAGQSTALITWDIVKGSTGYHVALGENKPVTTTQNRYQFTLSNIKTDCIDVTISAFNQYFESKGISTSVCK